MADAILNLDASTKLLDEKIAESLRKAEISYSKIGSSLRSSNLPLGRISKDAADFNESLKSAEARVITFGIAAGGIAIATKAFQGLLSSTIDVEKSLVDINVILNESSTGIQKFSKGLFEAAKFTGQSFDSAAKAATELARQGLGAEEVLKRTRDSLILVRLAGISEKDALEAITAAINSFSKSVIDSTQLVNKLANVDAAFAVSSADLAEAIKRVGSTAEDSGVSLDQLIALTTSAQQITSRGGAVIGNALKTIFQRVERPETIKQLEELGFSVRNLTTGEILPAIDILKKLGAGFDQLGKTQQNQIVQFSAGLFQANQFRAILSDLSKGGLSTYAQALDKSSSSTTEATDRTKELNKTLSAILNETTNNLKQLGSSLGGGIATPFIKSILGTINGVANLINGQEVGGVGEKIGKGIIDGIGRALVVTGIPVLSLALVKLISRFTVYIKDSFSQLISLGSAQKDILTTQESLNARMAGQTSLLSAANQQAQIRLALEQKTLNSLEKQNIILTTRGGKANLNDLNLRGATYASLQDKGFINSAIAGALPRLNSDTDPRSIIGQVNSQLSRTGNFSQDQLNQVVKPYVRQQILDADRLRINIAQQEDAERRIRFSSGFATSSFNNQYTAIGSSFGPGGLFQTPSRNPALSQAQLAASQARSSRLATGAFALSTVGLPILAETFSQFTPDTLGGRRTSSVLRGVADIGSLAGLGAAIGSTAGPVGTGVGATIGATIGIGKALIDVVNNWNDILPDLTKNIERLNTSSAKASEGVQLFLNSIDKLKNSSLSVEDRIDLIIKRDNALNNKDILPEDRKKLTEAFDNGGEEGIIKALKDLKEAKDFAKSLDVFNNVTFTKFTDILGGSEERIKREKEGRGALEDAFGKAGLSKILSQNPFALSTLSEDVKLGGDVGNIDKFARNIQSVFKGEGKEDVGKQISQSLLKANANNPFDTKLILNDIFFGTDGAFNQKAIERLKKITEEVKKRQPELDKAQKENEDNLAKFYDSIRDSIKETVDATNKISKQGQNFISGENISLNTSSIARRNTVDLTGIAISPLQSAARFGAIDRSQIIGQGEIGKKQQSVDIFNQISGLGLDDLRKLAEDKSKANALFVDGGKNFLASLDLFKGLRTEISKRIESDNLDLKSVGEIYLSAIDNLKRAKVSTNDDSIRKEIDGNIASIDKAYTDYLKNVNAIENSINEKTADFDSNLTATNEKLKLFRNRGGINSRFNSGQISGVERSQELETLRLSENRRSDFTSSQGLSGAGEAFGSALAFNKTDFFDTLQKDAKDTAQLIKDSFKSAFDSFADSTKSGKEAFRDFALSISKSIGSKAFGLGIDSFFGGLQTLGKGLFGSSKLPNYAATGGEVTSGSGTKDDVPYLLTKGEYILNKSVVSKLGARNLDAINNGANLNFENSYDFIGGARPTSGRARTSSQLTSFALEDNNNPQNTLRLSREQGLFSYIQGRNAYNTQNAQTLRDFNKQQQNALISAYIQAGIGVAGAGLQAGLSGGGPKYSSTSNEIKALEISRGMTGGGGNPFNGAKFASGGRVDTIPAMLSPGEYVTNADSVRKVGVGFMESVNRGIKPSDSSSYDNGSGKMLELLQSLSDSIKSTNQSVAAPGGNVYSNISIVINKDGDISANTSSSNSKDGNKKDESDPEQSRKLSELVKGTVLKVITEQQRPGGLLYTTKK